MAIVWACDGASAIVFDDPHDEIGPPMGYAGMLALAGRLTHSAGLATVYASYCASTGRRPR